MPQNLGNRIKAIRERLNLTQADLAEKSKLASHQIISEIERGNREIKAFELSQIAGALHISINELMAPDELTPARVLWREEPERAEEKEARFLELCRRYLNLKQACGIHSSSLFGGEKVVSDYHEVERLAEETRKTLGLGAYPAKELAHILEADFDFLIDYSDLGEDGSAACSSGPFGNAILVNSREAPWRRNYDIAHELFHLLTWNDAESDDCPDEATEQFANAFASHLLLPADTVSVEIDDIIDDGKIAFVDMIELARKFDVSTSALLWRLRSLRYLNPEVVEQVLENPTFRSLDKTTMTPHWWEPPDLPEKYVRIAFLAYMKGNLSKSKLAEHLDTNLIGVDRKLAEYGLIETEGLQESVNTC